MFQHNERQAMSPKQAEYLQALRELYPVVHAESAAKFDSASLRIGYIERTIKNRWGAKRFPSKQSAAREALLRHNGDVLRAYSELRTHVGANRTLTFKSKNSYGELVARSLDEQREELSAVLERERPAVLAYMQRTGVEPVDDSTPNPYVEPVDEFLTDALDGVDELLDDLRDELRSEEAHPFDWKPDGFWLSPKAFLEHHQANRAECIRRAEVAEPLDEVSMRPALAARALYEVGAPWAGSFVLDSYTKTWPTDVRRKMDVQTFGAEFVNEPPTEFADKLPKNHHSGLPLALWVVKARGNLFVKGPKGSGKTHLAASLAGILDLPWGFSPLTDGASYTWLTGSQTIAGYVTRPFVECFTHGGVFLGDEIDGADANMLLVLNAALANGEWSNPVTGEILQKHPDFVFVAAANTWGLGADGSYRGRNALDGATLDRFAPWRVEIGYDNALERELFFR